MTDSVDKTTNAIKDPTDKFMRIELAYNRDIVLSIHAGMGFLSVLSQGVFERDGVPNTETSPFRVTILSRSQFSEKTQLLLD